MTDQTAAGLAEQAIRELCIGSVEWHVSTEDGAYCMSFGYDGSINPEREAAEWLERLQKTYTHRFMGHKVRRVVVQSKLQEVALALLAQLEEQRAVSARMEADAWKPLSTAPEGVRVLLGPRNAPVVGIVRHMPEWADEQESVANVIHYNGNTLVAGYHCAEWHPLPSAAIDAAIASQQAGGKA
jgi:hypothetical protein